MANLIDTLPITEATDSYVLCGGLYATADDSGRHSMLAPMYQLDQITLQDLPARQTIQAGDQLQRYDDGSLKHVPIGDAAP